jgi:hypothetical protein
VWRVGCLYAIAAIISPRLAFLAVWLFSDRVNAAFGNWVVPILGFLFAPWTALVYVFVVGPGHLLHGADWLWLVIAFLVDMGAYGARGIEGRKRRRRIITHK